MKAADNFSRLWNGAEPGWVVVCHTEDRQTLQAIFSSAGPNMSEVKALRAAVPALGHLPAAEVVATLRGEPKFSLGDHGSVAARELRGRCEALGLRVESQAYQALSYSLMNELTNACLLIEDAAEGKAVAEEAIKQGLPVRHSTA